MYLNIESHKGPLAPVTYKRDENEAELLFSQDIDDKLKELNSKYKFKKPVIGRIGWLRALGQLGYKPDMLKYKKDLR